MLWDIDGTLVDSAGHGGDAFAEAYEAVTGSPPAERVPMHGRTDHQIATTMLEKGGAGDVDGRLPRMLDELARVLAGKRELMSREGRAYAGAAVVLERLARREDVIQSLLTGNVEANAAVKLGAFDLDRHVDLEVGGYGSDPHEARSELVAIARGRAAEKYGEPAEAVLIGDTPLDVIAAHEAGARAVAVASGPYSVEELRAAGAEAVLPDLRDTDAVVAAVTRR